MIDKPEQFVLAKSSKEGFVFYTEMDLNTSEVLCFDVFGYIN
jgi:hypothetical protein